MQALFGQSEYSVPCLLLPAGVSQQAGWGPRDAELGRRPG